MLITTPEFTLIELHLVSDGGRGSARGGYKFNIPRSTGRRQSIHQFQNSLQSTREGSRLLVQNVPTVGRLGGMKVLSCG